MTGAQILEMMPVPKPDHVDAPHRHHPEAVSFPYDITMAQMHHGHHLEQQQTLRHL